MTENERTALTIVNYVQLLGNIVSYVQLLSVIANYCQLLSIICNYLHLPSCGRLVAGLRTSSRGDDRAETK